MAIVFKPGSFHNGWTVLRATESSAYVMAQCACGNVRKIATTVLREGTRLGCYECYQARRAASVEARKEHAISVSSYTKRACKRGHPFTKDSFRIKSKKVKGKVYYTRDCLICHRAREMQYRLRDKSQQEYPFEDVKKILQRSAAIPTMSISADGADRAGTFPVIKPKED